MSELSVIVPFVREWPQIAFTLRSIHEELEGIDHEVLAIDNLVEKMQEDRGSKNIKGMANEWQNRQDPWLKYFHYTEKLSHWQCKNFGISQAKSDIYWFVDAHCIIPKNTASRMFRYYKQNWKELNGSIHMPLTYHILEPRQLMYKSVVEPGAGDYGYTFHTFNQNIYSNDTVVKVPAMSTCGMMIHREFMDLLGGWPKELGIYSGGEHFLNYTQAVLGMEKYVFISKSLCHHGDKRGYSWNHYDQQRNRAIATYMFGGREVLDLWLERKARLTNGEKNRCKRSIIETSGEHREWIKQNQLLDIKEWVEKWRSEELMIYH